MKNKEKDNGLNKDDSPKPWALDTRLLCREPTIKLSSKKRFLAN
jgi:hypothetical protein